MTPNRIIEHIFHVPDLHQVNEAALNSMVADYPYFAAARILLARKDFSRHNDVNSPAVKAGSLYSHQQHYYYNFVTSAPVLMEVEERIPAIIPEDALPTGPSADLLDAVATTPVNPLRIVARATEESPVAEAISTPLQEATVAEIMDAIAEESNIDNEGALSVTGEMPGYPETTHAADAVVAQQESEAPVAVIGETLPHPETTHAADAVVAQEESEAPPAVDEEMLPSPDTTETTDEANALEEEEMETEKELDSLNPGIHLAAENNTDTAAPENPEPMIKIFPLELSDDAPTELIFQPLYTDDYFAYKRLKDPEHADELSVQGEAEMKSFTSWLREIKDNFAGKTNKDWYQQQLHRIYEEDEEPEISETVEKMALDSIRINNDIVSETLADIWVRQRQYQNAIQIYQKLSLLNPDKNAYFAQKIKELKSLIDNKNKQS
ncbi:hypothetical protein SAMN05444266_104253 [Chitinophaga jiangningensis]|uniref:Tetratricopeptide repeat-containing protein n=1 Tax=Chitinophaga jiangningensis TaxID=1419482 RepID=A0A1M7CB38_9BACT|nr:hypothetical protein [Chitinophaga jiangningensis]SHL64109.1 hypothetical protein SAMN05444266_104253 [Chitinophaga jiangningensis]